jgi:hypothetical protein
MPQWISDLISVAPVIGGLCLVGFVVWKTWPFVRKINHFIDDMLGTEARPGVDAKPGWNERLDRIEHELHPNSGKSLRDAVDQQGRDLKAHIESCPPPTVTTVNVNAGSQP